MTSAPLHLVPDLVSAGSPDDQFPDRNGTVRRRSTDEDIETAIKRLKPDPDVDGGVGAADSDHEDKKNDDQTDSRSRGAGG